MGARWKSPDSPSRLYASLEVGLAALLACVGAALFIAMPNLLAEGGIPEAQDFTRLSPVFFPRLAFGLLSLLGLFYLVFSLRQLAATEAGVSEVDGSTIVRVLKVYGCALLYPMLMPYLGFLFSSCLLIGVLAVLVGKRVWWQVIAFAVIAPLTIRFVFERLLSIALPFASIEVLSDLEEAIMRLLVKVLL